MHFKLVIVILLMLILVLLAGCFGENECYLSVIVTPSGSGYVVPSSGWHTRNSTFVLAACPYAGYRFKNWTGEVSGSGTLATITMDSSKTVTATFE